MKMQLFQIEKISKYGEKNTNWKEKLIQVLLDMFVLENISSSAVERLQYFRAPLIISMQNKSSRRKLVEKKRDAKTAYNGMLGNDLKLCSNVRWKDATRAQMCAVDISHEKKIRAKLSRDEEGRK